MPRWQSLFNLVKIGGTEVTGRDWSQDFQHIGGHRYQYKAVDSGSLSVAASTTTSWLSVSGVGIYICPRYMHFSGVTYSHMLWHIYVDNFQPLGAETGEFLDPPHLNLWGWGAVGVHSMGEFACRVITWDTTNNNFAAHGYSRPPRFFRNTLESAFTNNDSANAATMQGMIDYYLFVASKQALVTLDNHIHAKRIRKLLDKRVEAVEVMTLGKFENEEDHPYREFLSITDREYHRTDQAKRSPRTLAVITYPDNMELNDILNKFKPKKILHDNVLE